MRLFIAALTALLFVIAAFGIGFGVYVVVHAMHSADEAGRAANIGSAILAGIVPFLIGTVALGGVAVTLAVLYTGDQRR